MRSRVFLVSLLILCLIVPSGVMASYIALPIPTPTVTIQDQPIRVVTATVPPQTGGVTIATVPSGAQVTIDGTVVGTTPFTSRTLSTGTHSVVLSLSGYKDMPVSLFITAGGFTQETYTLIPLTTATTILPALKPIAIPSILPATPTPAPTVNLPLGNLTEKFRFPEPVSIKPVIITVGNHSFTPHLTTLSPYYNYQLIGQSTSGGTQWHAADILTTPTAYIEVDSHNVYLPGSHVMSSVEMADDPVWGQEDSVPIATTDNFFNNTNFRWISQENGLTGFYQVSRFPFDSNASHWQNKYVPGLVQSGPVKDIHVDSDGFHYFTLNFAPIANHKFGDPPIYTGVAKIDETVPGRGMSMGLWQIPGTGIGIYTRNTKLGPVTLGIPAAIETIPHGELTEAQLGNPNDNLIYSTSVKGSFDSALATSVENALEDMPQTYYVRVVPIRGDGSAGIPTIPVTVTAVRPKPCPPTPPSNTVNYVVASPPSAQISSFYMTSFIPDWIHTDQDGKLVSRAYFVTVASPSYCSAGSQQTSSGGGSQNSMESQLNSQLCSSYGGGQIGYHFYADPEETHWYDTVWDIITGLFGAFTEVIHAVSTAWAEIQNIAIQVAAGIVQGLTFGQFNCNDSDACKDVLRTGLTIAESSLGIPPTVPDVSDLENMGADYMAKVAGEELGVGGALDAAQNVYSSIPDSAKDKIEQNSEQVGQNLAGALVTSSANSMQAAAGNWYVPDPLYYQAHPAYIMVKVSNPNDQPTDPVSMDVTDSGGLYKVMNEIYVPPLKPHDSTVIPVVLSENYDNVYTTGCTADSYTSECGDICVPCYWNLWWGRALDVSRNGGDTFSVTFSESKNGFNLNQLDAASSGKVLASQNIMNFDEQGKSCGSYNAKSILKYPDNWQITLNNLNENLESLMWLKYSFTEGDHGKMIGQ